MRTLLAALLTLGILLCLLLAGCTPYADDDADEGRGTGVALSLGSVTVAEQKDGKQGVDTRADTPVDGLEQWPGFQGGDNLYVGITSGSLPGGGRYHYDDGNIWLATRNSAYWQSGAAKNTVRITNKGVGDYTLPDSYEADAATKWHTWDVLTYQEENVAPVSPYSCQLQHAMAQLCVELAPGTEIKTDQLQSATVKALNADCEFSISLFEGDEPLQKQSGTPKSITLLKNGATSLKHYALLLPEQNYAAAQKMIEINIGNESYSFTPTEALMLKAGTCLHLTLTVSKTGVSGWTVSSTNWDDEVTTGGKPGEDSEVTVIENTAGGLEAALNSFSGTKLMITGEINDADMGALKEAIKNKNITEVYIMATGVANLEDNAFRDCTTLESISMPGITGSIGEEAFEGCTALQSISLPEVTGDIGNYTFNGCTALQNVSLPRVTGSIGNCTFKGCTALQSVSLPEVTGDIGNYTFNGCTALQNVSLPRVTGSIGDYAFKGCTALQSVSLPGVTGSIGNYAFKGCTALQSVSLPGVIGNIGSEAFNGCKSLQSVNLPEVTGNIGDGAFQGCTALQDISLPKIKRDIEYHAFYGCTALESISLPEAAGNIQYNAFYGCTALESINMPKAAGSIGSNAFWGCTALKSISLPEMTGNIGEYAFLRCAALQDVKLPKMTGYIEGGAFQECTALKSIDLPGVTGSIGDGAFAVCTALKSVSLSGVTGNIGNMAFLNCKALESINLPEMAGNIQNNAFEMCTALKSIDLPEVTGSIGDAAFLNCTALKSVSLPKVTSIGSTAFYSCTALQSISLPKVTSIGSTAFASCTSLESIVLSGYDLNLNQVSLPTTADNAFIDCPVSILFLRDVPKEIDVAAYQSWADVSWIAIHYDYDDLNDDTDVGSYSGHWLRP